MSNPQLEPNANSTQTSKKGIWVIAGSTAALTLGLMALSMLGGGFGSADAEAAGSQDGYLGWAITIHLATAIPALLLGPVILRRRKGDALHKLLGRIWVGLMLVTAIASAFIRSPGAGIAGTGFSFIHIFTIWTLVTVPLAIYAIRKGDVKAHSQAMTGLYIGLCVAGAFTLIPGRVLGNWVFGF